MLGEYATQNFLKLLFALAIFFSILLANGGSKGEEVNREEAFKDFKNVPNPDIFSASLGTGYAEVEGQEGKEIQVSDKGLLFLRRKEYDAPPALEAQAASVGDMKSGESYLDVDAKGRWPMASLAKLASAVVAIKVLNLGEEVTIYKNGAPLDGARSILHEGGRYSVRDLITAMLIASSNEAAEAMANFYGRDKFITAMNEEASIWGLVSTNFSDPAGLSVSNQSTAADIMKMTMRVNEEYPQVFRITRGKKATIDNLASGKEEVINSTHPFAEQPEFLGGKTGYTDDANGNLISIFSYEGRPIGVVILGSNDRFGDTQKIFEWFKQNYTLRAGY